ncbi:DNA repair protein RAD57 [Candida albicans P34048]|nr:DNA repair protein RAD57 [Candida albicans P34048]
MDDYKQLGPGIFSCSRKFPFLTTRLQQYGKSINDLLQYDEASDHAQLARLVDRPMKEINDYYRNLKKDLQVDPTSVNSLLDSEFISTGLPSIDRELGGGIPIGEVTEIFGASGCGKSHFLFQLLSNCGKEFPTSKNIYISTESFLETKRLKDFIGRNSSNIDTDLDRISYIYCQDLESQDHILFTQLPLKLDSDKEKTKLLVLDSIAQHFRREDSIMNSTYLKEKLEVQEGEIADDRSFQEVKRKQMNQLRRFNKSQKYASRTAKLYYICQLYQHLSRLAQDFNIAIVIVNQVSDYSFESSGSFTEAEAGELDYPLNLDFQTAVSSGWDSRTIYNSIPTANITLKNEEIENLEMELAKSLEERSPNKRQKLSNTSSPQKQEHNLNPRERLERQKSLISKSHEMRNRGSKKIVPTLGYPWATRIKNRIMLSKVYKPILKSNMDGDIVNNDQSLQTNSIHDKRSSAELYKSFVSIDGWQVERFAKVVTSTHGYNPNRFKRYRFIINSQGLAEV